MAAKHIHNNSIIGQDGVNLIERIVSGMGYLWRPTSMYDAGVDGEIEIRDPTTGQVTNCIIKVQSKATTRTFARESDSACHYVCDADDIEYWLNGNVPVILVISRPDRNEAYWKHVTEYFRDPRRQADRRVVLDKVADRFDTSAADALRNIAAPKDPGLFLPPPSESEPLYSNLIPRLFAAQRRRTRILRLAVEYGCRANSSGERLHTLVGKALGKRFTWSQNEEFAVNVGIVGEAGTGDESRLHISTALCSRGPALVSFVYAHQVAHVLLEHDSEGSFLYGYYTRGEAEADLFAYAYLYTTSQVAIPCGVTLPYARIAIVIKTLRKDDKGFFWPEGKRLLDIHQTIMELKEEEQESR